MEFCLRRYFDRLRLRTGVILDIVTTLLDNSQSLSVADSMTYCVRYSQSSILSYQNCSNHSPIDHRLGLGSSL